MFSSRLQWDVQPNPLSLLLEQKRTAGTRVLDLTESNPTRARFEYPGEIIHALAHERALRYDPAPRGIVRAREAVARYYAGRGREVAPDQILITASTSEAYSYLFKLLTNPGDEVLTPRPSYPLFDFLAAFESVNVCQYPLRYDGSWHVDFDALRRLITPRTRAIVMVNPNNPTGSFLTQDEWNRLETLGLPILVDEVFSDYAFDGVRRSTGQARVLTFSMSGLSKIAGLPQMKLGWILASGPGSANALERLELIADTYLSVATPIQEALPEILHAAESVQAQIRERTCANREVLRSILQDSPAHVLEAEGGWYGVIQVPRTRSEEEWCLTLLGAHDVLVQPGFFFDFETEAFLVVSLLTAPEVFREGMQRILATL